MADSALSERESDAQELLAAAAGAVVRVLEGVSSETVDAAVKRLEFALGRWHDATDLA